MFVYYAAGAAGSIAGPAMLARYGWTAVCGVAATVSIVGLSITVARHFVALAASGVDMDAGDASSNEHIAR
jgi:hypothetical protein